MVIVLFSYGCYNKLIQTRCLKTTEIYSLTVFRPEVWNQGMSGATLPPKAWVVPYIQWLSTSVFTGPSPPYVSVLSLSSLLRTRVLGFRVYVDGPEDLSHDPFGGHHSTHGRPLSFWIDPWCLPGFVTSCVSHLEKYWLTDLCGSSKCWHILFSVQFSRSIVSDSLQPHELQHTRPPCPSPTPGVHSNTCPSSRWCHPAILCRPLLLLPPIPPSIRVFSSESTFCFNNMLKKSCLLISPTKWIRRLFQRRKAVRLMVAETNFPKL